MDDETFPHKPFASAKELLLTSLFCAVLWISTFTWLFPLFFCLFLSSWLRNKFFPILFGFISGEKRWAYLEKMRRELFDRIRRETPGRKGLKFLEIGVGFGANFRYYRTDDVVTLLDMNPNFQTALRGELKKYPDVKVHRYVISPAEDMKDIGDGEFDVVVCTHMFCSATDRKKVMEESWRVLKTGGKLACMEHIGYPKDHLAYWIQKAISPLWTVYCNGCRLDRCWKNELNKVFSGVDYDVFYPTFMPMILRSHAIALATK